MSKKVLVVSSSPRKNSNSDALCESFAKGAKEAGHTVEKISLLGKKIEFCTACGLCETPAGCPKKDDVKDILDKMMAADVIVLGTPVYFYTMCAQLKAVIDRSVMVYPNMKNKEFYFIMTMGDTAAENFKGTIEALRGFVACCEGSRECGIISAAGVYGPNTIVGNPALEQAYQAGRKA